MATATRLTNTGTFLVNGTFDEFTGAPIVDSSLIKWLDAGQPQSLATTATTNARWFDLSGFGSYTTLSTATSYSSFGGGSVVFNGGGAINMATVATYPTTFADPWTAEVWIYIPSSVTWGTTNKTSLFQKGSYSGFHGLTLTTVNNQVAVSLRGSTGGSNYSVGNIGRDAWYNVVGTWSGNTSGGQLNLYINGVLAQATTPTVVEAPGGTVWVLGSNTVESAPGNYFTGSMSNVKLYNRVLTSTEIAKNYNALAPRYSLTTISTQTGVIRTTTNTVYASSIDEVTYNSTAPVIKNLLTYSEQLDNAVWLKASSTVSNNVLDTLSPIGDQTADKIIEDTTTSTSHGVQYGGITKNSTATTMTFSVYAKAAERTWVGLVINDDVGGFGVGRYGAEFDLVAGISYNHDGAQGTFTNGSRQISNAGNGWYRCSITCTTFSEAKVRTRIFILNNTTTNTITWTSAAGYNGNGTSGVYAWGAQIETSTTPTIYQGVAAANTLVSTPFAKREDNNGNIYIKDIFDEVAATFTWTFTATSVGYSSTGWQGIQSKFTGGLADSNYFDTSSFWGSIQSNYPSITAVFPTTYNVSNIYLGPVDAAANGSWGPGYTSGAIQSSTDNVNWTTLTNATFTIPGKTLVFPVNTTTNYIRLQSLNTSNWLAVSEFYFDVKY